MSRMPGPGGIPVNDKDSAQICWELWRGGVLLQCWCRNQSCCGCHGVGMDELTVCVWAEDAAVSWCC